MLPSMASSQAPVSLFLLTGLVLTFAVIIGACVKGSRDRIAHRTSPVVVIVGVIAVAVAVLMYMS